MSGNVTRLISAIAQDEDQATDELIQVVYQQLRVLAVQILSREKSGQTLQATALVHEAYLRLVGSEVQDWQSRGHFYAAAAEAMRRILIGNARRKKSLKRGGEYVRIELNEAVLGGEGGGDALDLLALDEALQGLMKKDPVKGELVKLRYFAGVTFEQAAEILGISVVTAKRYWSYARAWLIREMG